MDRERYQTVYASAQGSVAAPTAGLHFTRPVVRRARGRGVERTEITLHVGYGTFKPVRVGDSRRARGRSRAIRDLRSRRGGAINRARAEGRRVVAVGTTTTRALEHAALGGGGRVAAGAATPTRSSTPASISDCRRAIDQLPSAPVVAADAGLPPLPAARVLAAYREAVAREYRFYSYGDAMLIV